MIEIWPLKVRMLNLKSIWRGVAPAKDEFKFDDHMVVVAVLLGHEMTVIWSSNLGS